MSDLPQSTVEAMARARYERSRGLGTYTWEERNQMLPAHSDLEEAAADLQAALDEGDVVLKSDLQRAWNERDELDAALTALREAAKVLLDRHDGVNRWPWLTSIVDAIHTGGISLATKNLADEDWERLRRELER